MSKARELLDLLEERDKIIQDENLRNLIKRGKKFADWAVKVLSKAKKGLAVEKQETKDMVHTFFKLLKAKLNLDPNNPPSEKEIKVAIRQFKDVAKVALVAAVLLGPLPGDEPLLLGLEMLARKFGVSFFPSALQGIF